MNVEQIIDAMLEEKSDTVVEVAEASHEISKAFEWVCSDMDSELMGKYQEIADANPNAGPEELTELLRAVDPWEVLADWWKP